jgi:hypothetical protein
VSLGSSGLVFEGLRGRTDLSEILTAVGVA